MYFIIETYVNASLTIAWQACMGVRCRSLKGLGTVGSGPGGRLYITKNLTRRSKANWRKPNISTRISTPLYSQVPRTLIWISPIFFRVDSLNLFITPYTEVLDEFWTKSPNTHLWDHSFFGNTNFWVISYLYNRDWFPLYLYAKEVNNKEKAKKRKEKRRKSKKMQHKKKNIRNQTASSIKCHQKDRE